MDCLDNIVGLSGSECDCYIDGRPDGYNISTSGMFLDDLAGIGDLLNGENCGEAWDNLINCRNAGIKMFLSDIKTLLITSREYHLTRRTVSDVAIGQAKGRNVYTLKEPISFTKIKTPGVLGAYMDISRIGLIMDASEEITVSLHDTVNGHLISKTVHAQAGIASFVSFNLKLPLWNKYDDDFAYFVIYQPVTARPMLNKSSCGCGGNVVYNDKAPSYNRASVNIKAPWSNWVMVGSGECSTVEEAYLKDVRNERMNGVIIDVSMYCELDSIICNGIKAGNGAIASAILYASALFVANTNSSLDFNDRHKWESLYSEYLNAVADTIEIPKNGCLSCNSKYNRTSRRIML